MLNTRRKTIRSDGTARRSTIAIVCGKKMGYVAYKPRGGGPVPTSAQWLPRISDDTNKSDMDCQSGCSPKFVAAANTASNEMRKERLMADDALSKAST